MKERNEEIYIKISKTFEWELFQKFSLRKKF